jgi:chromosome segregation ATPase
MTAIAPTNSSNVVSKCCLFSWTKKVGTYSWALPWIGIAIAIIGVATMIFSSSYGGAVGFTLFGLSIIHYQYFAEDKEAKELETEIEKTDQELEARQKAIESTTAQLNALQKSSDQARLAFGKTIEGLKKENTTLGQTLKDLQTEHKAFGQENETLKSTVHTLQKQIAASEASGAVFEEQIKAFIAQHKQFMPQLEQLSGIVQGLERADQKFQGDLRGIDQTFRQDLENFSRYIRTSKGIIDAITEQNKALQSELATLRVSQSEGLVSVQRLEAANRDLRATVLEKQQNLTRMEQLKTALDEQEQRLHQQTELLEQGVQKLHIEREQFEAAKQAATPS